MKHIIIICAIALYGCNTTSVKTQPENNDQQGMPSQQWLDFMRPAIAASMCDDKDLIRSCFNVNKKECEQIALATVATCIDLLKPNIPSHISREQARHLGGTLGVCSAKGYALVNHKAFISKPECVKFNIDKIRHNK